MRTYEEAMHAIQTGVKMGIGIDEGRYADGYEFEDRSITGRKHMRVGVDSAMVSDEALVTLLVKKGIITKEEYLEELAAAANREVERLEKDLSHKLGTKVTLV